MATFASSISPDECPTVPGASNRLLVLGEHCTEGKENSYNL